MINVARVKSHHAINGGYLPSFEAAKGRFMMMFRQPEQRLLSHYYYLNSKTGAYPNMTLADAKDSLAGMVTRQMSRTENIGSSALLYAVGGEVAAYVAYKNGMDAWLYPTETNQAEVDRAKYQLLSGGFSFIGITDQWDLSICLFNVMFNQTCRSYQFSNIRPTTGNSSTSYDATDLDEREAFFDEFVRYESPLLDGWHDPWDGQLYDIALNIFADNLKKYDVSASTCKQCWDDAGLAERRAPTKVVKVY